MLWLRERHGVPLGLVTGLLYPGHSVTRMMGTPNRTGEELMAAMLSAATPAGVDTLEQATATDLVAADGRVSAVVVTRPDGARETSGCGALVLACSGFGGNADMVARHIPEIAGAVIHGHPGNKGDALAWGRALGAATADMGAYQGHGALFHTHGGLIVDEDARVLRADGSPLPNLFAGGAARGVSGAGAAGYICRQRPPHRHRLRSPCRPRRRTIGDTRMKSIIDQAPHAALVKGGHDDRAAQDFVFTLRNLVTAELIARQPRRLRSSRQPGACETDRHGL